MDYNIRRANVNDVNFIIETILNAEKSGTEIIPLSAIFEVSESTLINYLRQMFEEEIDGCEFSISSFLIAEFNNKPVAAFAGWVEDSKMPSAIIKSNLISFIFGRDSVMMLKEKSAIINDILIKRNADWLQLEYLFVSAEHRGKGLVAKLIDGHVNEAIKVNKIVKGIEVQVFENNVPAIKVYEKYGFGVAKVYSCTDVQASKYLPHTTKLLMQKLIL